jgi:multidrug efflux pump
VVLTALAAILAMIPLSRSAFWGPMAVTIMGGLFIATFLTLLFVPALYALWNRRSLREQDELKSSRDFLFASPAPRRDGRVNNDGIFEAAR